MASNAADREVTIVVPVWNGAELLRRLLASISRQTLQPVEVIAVNNGSTDDAPEAARQWGARVIQMSRNAGFAAAANRGIAECRTDWVALINSDVELDPEWLFLLVESAITYDASFAAGKILMASRPELLDGCWDLVARSGCGWRAGHGMPDSPVFAQRRSIAFASATAVLYQRSLFDRIGPFAEIYESYLEDIDLSIRCSAAGFQGVYVPEAVCRHQGSASMGAWSRRATWLIARNQSILVRRLFPKALRREWWRSVLVGHLLWGLLALRRGRVISWARGKVAARSIRIEPLALDCASLRTTLLASEREIRRLQEHKGDLYWRIYFLLTRAWFRGESK